MKAKRIRTDRVVILVSILFVVSIFIAIAVMNSKTTGSTEPPVNGPVIVDEEVKKATDEPLMVVSEGTVSMEPSEEDEIQQFSDELATVEDWAVKTVMQEFFSGPAWDDLKPYYSNRLGRYVSRYEMYNLVLVTCSESGHEPLAGKTAVVSTILNRLEDTNGWFGDSIYDVIFQPGQFSSVEAGRFYWGYPYRTEWVYEEIPEEMLSEAKQAVYSALDGNDPTNGALYFFNPECTSYDELAMRDNIDGVITIGSHVFYKYWN